MKRLGLVCLLVFALLGIAITSYAEVKRLEFTEVEAVQSLPEGLLIRINGEGIMVPKPKGESLWVTLHMKGGGERTVGFNIQLERKGTQLVPIIPVTPTPTPQSPDQNYKYHIDIKGQDISFIKQKLQEFKLTKREQEIITNWLSRSNLDRYTTFAIGYDETGNLVLKLSGPSSQATTVYEKRILSPEPVSIWKPKEELHPEAIKFTTELGKQKFPGYVFSAGPSQIEIQVPDDITIHGATEPLDYCTTTTDEIQLGEEQQGE